MGEKGEQPRAFVQRARDCIEAGDTPAAVAELQRGLALHAQSPKLLFELGYLLYETGETARSYELLRRAVSTSSAPNCRVFFTLSEVCGEAEAWEWAERGVTAGSKQLQLLQAEADSASDSGAPRRVALLGKITALKRVVAQGCCKLAELAADSDRSPEDALLALGESSRLDPAYLEPYSRLLVFHFNAQNEAGFDSTLAALLQQVRELEASDDEELDRYDPEFFHNVSRLLLETERLAEAVEWTETAMGVHPRDLMALYLHAFACWRAGEGGEAAVIVEDLRALNVLECGDEELIAGFCELSEALAAMES